MTKHIFLGKYQLGVIVDIYKIQRTVSEILPYISLILELLLPPHTVAHELPLEEEVHESFW